MRVLLVVVLSVILTSALRSQSIHTVIDHAYGTALVRTADGGLAIVGNSDLYFEDAFFIVKFLPSLTIRWARRHYSDFQTPTSIAQLKTGGYLLSGREIVTTDTSGNVLGWMSELSGSAIATSDNGLLISGYGRITDSVISHAAQFIKLDSNGYFQWKQTLRDEAATYAGSFGLAAMEDKSGAFFLAG